MKFQILRCMGGGLRVVERSPFCVTWSDYEGRVTYAVAAGDRMAEITLHPHMCNLTEMGSICRGYFSRKDSYRGVAARTELIYQPVCVSACGMELFLVEWVRICIGMHRSIPLGMDNGMALLTFACPCEIGRRILSRGHEVCSIGAAC